MGTVIGDILPLAVGVALSPIPIIAVILMLFSKNARSTSLGFLTGWFLGVTVTTTIIVFVADPAKQATGGEELLLFSIVHVLLGLLLLFAAYRNWQKRPKPGETVEMPKWMSSIDTMTAGKALIMGALLSSLNPKNLALIIGAGVAIVAGGLNSTQTLVALIIFIVIACISVAVPVIVYLVMGEKAAPTLNSWKVWLTHNNATVMMVLLLVFGIVVLSKGIGALIGVKGKNMAHTPLIPARDWLAHYPRAWLSADIVAGATAAAVVLPQAMAYASLAGLPVEHGLYTALVMLPLYALLGTSRVLSVTVTSPIALLAATAILPLVAPGDTGAYTRAAATLAVIVGVMLALVGVLRLGFLANFISLPTLTGFKFGMGLLIASSQLGKLLGIPFQSTGFLRNIYSALSQWNAINLPTLAVSILTVAVMLALARWSPRLPAALVAVVLGIEVMALTNMEALGVALISPIPSGLPSFALPDLSYVKGLAAPALGIVLMSAIESISVGRTFARAHDPRIDTNRELIAIGAANFGAGLFQGFPGGGGTSQTAVNAQAGAKTQVSSLVTAVIAVLGLTLLAPVLSLMPQATLGATVLVASLGLLKLNTFRRIAAVRRRDAILAVIAALSVLLLGPLEGILTAVAISLLTLLYEMNHPQVYIMGRRHGSTDFRDLQHHPQDETFPGLLIVHPVGRIYFANVERVHSHVLELIRAAPAPVKILLLDASSISDLEFTVLDAFARMGREMEGYGATLWIAALNPQPLDMVQRFISGRQIPSERLFCSVEDGVNAYLKRFEAKQEAGEITLP